MEKYCSVGEATDDNMAYGRFTLGTYGYKHTLGICNTNCLSTATMVARERLNFTFTYIACLVLVQNFQTGSGAYPSLLLN